MPLSFLFPLTGRSWRRTTGALRGYARTRQWAAFFGQSLREMAVCVQQAHLSDVALLPEEIQRVAARTGVCIRLFRKRGRPEGTFPYGGRDDGEGTGTELVAVEAARSAGRFSSPLLWCQRSSRHGIHASGEAGCHETWGAGVQCLRGCRWGWTGGWLWWRHVIAGGAEPAVDVKPFSVAEHGSSKCFRAGIK